MSEDGGKSALMEAKLRAAGKWNQRTEKIHAQANASSYVANNRWGARREAAAEAKRNFATSVLADTMAGDPDSARRGRNEGMDAPRKPVNRNVNYTPQDDYSQEEAQQAARQKQASALLPGNVSPGEDDSSNEL